MALSLWQVQVSFTTLAIFSGNAFQALIPFKLLYSLAKDENYISFLGATRLPVIKYHFFQYMTKDQKESVCRRQGSFWSYSVLCLNFVFFFSIGYKR
ncbi:MAG: hypothetical protein WBI53_04320, partial [Paludibacter sp.]